LAGSPLLSSPRWWHECIQGGEQGFPGDRGHPPVQSDHPVQTPGGRNTPQALLFHLIEEDAGTVHGVTPVGENPSRIRNPEILDDIDQ
jgi:hypothetical protein